LKLVAGAVSIAGGAGWRLIQLAGQPPRPPERFPDEKLNMPVHTAEFITCPLLKRTINVWVKAQGKRLFFRSYG
jgi:hypothetical protein